MHAEVLCAGKSDLTATATGMCTIAAINMLAKGDCPEKYIREEKLEESVAKMIDKKCEFNPKVHRKIEREVEKFNTMQAAINPGNPNEITSEAYIRFVFTNGSAREKSALLECISGQLKFANKEVWVD